jgi:hypothetical protein
MHLVKLLDDAGLARRSELASEAEAPRRRARENRRVA